MSMLGTSVAIRRPLLRVTNFENITMRCLACGEAMEVAQIESHDSLATCEHYTFRCKGCGETERRLLSRERVAAAEILRSIKIAQSSLLKPQEKKYRDYLLRTDPSNRLFRRRVTQARLGELMKNPKAFIEAFVREREQKD